MWGHEDMIEMRSNGRANCVRAGCLSYVDLLTGLLAASFLFPALIHIGAHMLRPEPLMVWKFIRHSGFDLVRCPQGMRMSSRITGFIIPGLFSLQLDKRLRNAPLELFYIPPAEAEACRCWVPAGLQSHLEL